MSSGSLKQFLKRTKRNVKKPPLHDFEKKIPITWKRWCTQILSALRYNIHIFKINSSIYFCYQSFSFLHSCSPPIVHGNLTCDTIYIQHNGLIKIGSGLLTWLSFINQSFIWYILLFRLLVAPDAIHQHVRTCREGMKNTHFIAPDASK